ncbi:putative carbonic anhydrase 5 [Homalodisca vitripennis]|uniref:putative carbonic anhydrase 5 n=1 Tax=Homalodisca vitripennis TaxID=197043 RepID=UPI001EEBBC8F|nr:putative carbonic anhydrase 5 [Homalodisca vitripennis]
MPSVLLLLALLLTEQEIGQVYCGSWKHSEDPKIEGWRGACTTGRYQSPISIIYKNLWYSKVPPLAFINYNNITTTICNNGHSVVFKVNQNHEAAIVNGGLKNLYILDEVGFHWGSEHTLKEKRYPLEMHLIHYNSLYDSKETALCRSDGLAIIAVLFCASLEDNVYFNPIISALENEYIYGSFGNMSTVPGPIDLQQLLPFESQRFFRYHGSLTTPPCSEIVTWTVMEHVSYISKNQLQRFCKVRTKTGGKTNFRWPKPLNNRKVYLLTGVQIQNSGNVAVIVCLSMLAILFDCQLL